MIKRQEDYETNKIIWSWSDNIYDTDFTLIPNTNYSIFVKKQNQNLNFIIRNLVTGIENVVSTAIETNQMGTGPVTIGGWVNNTDENFDGIISNVYARNTSYIGQIGQVGEINLKATIAASGNYTSREVIAPFKVNAISPVINSFGL